MRRLLFLALFLLLAAAAGASARRLQPGRDEPFDVDYVPSAGAVRWLSLGHPTLAANVMWLRTVQYVGEPRADARGWDRLLPLVDVVTDLDPRHGYVYQVSGNVLAGVGRVEESNRILEKGMRNVPERYILPFHRAVNAMLYEGDYAAAARWFERAAAVPGAPEHLREYVVNTYVKGDQADAAIDFLTRMLEESKDPESTKALEKQLTRARLEKAALQIDDAIDRWRERHLLWPFTAHQLVAEGLLPELPPDPAGGAWYVGADGRAHSSADPRRLQRPMSDAERQASLRTLRHTMRGQPTP